MRTISIFSLLTALVFNVSGQTTYFNNIQSEEWDRSTGTGVEVYEDHYITFGWHTIGDIYNGTYIQKFDLNGELVSNIFLADSSLVTSFANSSLVKNENIISTGGRNAVHMDFNGDLDWSIHKSFPEIFANNIVLSFGFESGDYLFGGQKYYDTDDNGNPDFGNLHLFKVDENGSEIWEREYEIYEDNSLLPCAVHELDNNDLIILGSSNSWGNGRRPFIMRTDMMGEMLYFSEFGQIEEENWYPRSVLEVNNDLITLVVLTTEEIDPDFGDLRALQIMQYDLTTDSFTYESEFEEIFIYNHVQDFVKTSDGGYAALGYRGSELIIKGYVIKYDSDLNIEWQREYKYADEYTQNHLYDFEITQDGGFICAGETLGLGPNPHPRTSWLLKLDACGEMEWQGCDTTTIHVSELERSLFSVYPNPASDKLTVSINSSILRNNTQVELRNTLGQEVLATQITASEQELDVSQLSSGIYMLSLVSDGRVSKGIGMNSERVIVE